MRMSAREATASPRSPALHRRCFGLRARVSSNYGVPGGHQIRAHRQAHPAHADETDRHHHTTLPSSRPQPASKNRQASQLIGPAQRQTRQAGQPHPRGDPGRPARIICGRKQMTEVCKS